MAYQEPMLVCRGCGRRWAEVDQACACKSRVSVCCGMILDREWGPADTGWESMARTMAVSFLAGIGVAAVVIYIVVFSPIVAVSAAALLTRP